jgi:hypothetical protein
LVKGILLFLVIELGLPSLAPNIANSNAYVALHMLRQRFPISTRSPIDDALDVGNLQAMFASHVVSRSKAADEFRVMVLGDSAVWGLQLSPEQTMPAQLDDLGLTCNGRKVRVYNLSFPKSSATKDLMILDQALSYQPDMLIWLVTWYTLMPKTRLDHFIITQNPAEFYKLGRRYDFLPRGFGAPTLVDDLYTANRALFRVARYQLYPLIQLSTGVDQMNSLPIVIPAELSPDPTFEGLKPPTLRSTQVSLDQVGDFYKLAGDIPVVLVNEPMLVLSGVPNSDIRYNNYYPRWVYDQYRQYLGEAAVQNRWDYLDLWNLFPARYFGDTPLHLHPKAEQLLAKDLAPAIERDCQ